MRRAMSHRRTVNSLTRKNAQRGAAECQAWNECIYLAAIIRLRLRRAEKYLLRLRPLPPAHASSKKYRHCRYRLHSTVMKSPVIRIAVTPCLSPYSAHPAPFLSPR